MTTKEELVTAIIHVRQDWVETTGASTIFASANVVLERAAERSSTALSPPKPRSTELRAIQAAPNDTTASTLIQTSVRD
jgi:hypothetical protein